MPVIHRLYSGPDGESHVEEMNMENHPELKRLQSVAGVRFVHREAGRYVDFHNTTERIWLGIVKGKMEVSVGDGSKYQYGPGDFRLIEDFTGRGHTTHWVEDTINIIVQCTTTLPE